MPNNLFDHSTSAEPEEIPSGTAGSAASVPLAEPLPDPDETSGPFPPLPGTVAVPSPSLPTPQPQTPFPAFHPCNINLKEGCYRVAFRPNSGINVFYGTMRVDKFGGKTTISGDLYRFLRFPLPLPPKGGATTLTAPPPSKTIFSLPFGIPIYARNKYYSYLKVTNIQKSPFGTTEPCMLNLTAQEYVYTQPPAGSFNGTFPAAPGTRTVSIVLSPAPIPLGFGSPYFHGKLYEGGIEKGSFTMGWVSSCFRKATVEIDTLTGAVAPAAVPSISGGGTEDIRTVFATAGWDLHILYDQTNVPVPPGVTATACWSSANLHALMLSVRNPATNLDTEWHMHLVVVPATMGCGRGVMYDTIGVPREGVASFCDDGYPSTDSSNFGAAANQKQRDVPRAFLRSASHELGHGFNQIHQEQEGGADNSIMTTTPSVADVLGGPATGAPGVFPNNINLGFNEHVRHHLAHFPDVVVRPGGMTFGTGHGSTVPEADKERHYFSDDELELQLHPETSRIELGQPLRLAWDLVNKAPVAIPVPSDIRIEAQHTYISVINPGGASKPMASFSIETGAVKIEDLNPGQRLEAETRVFWSARDGFAFEMPGRHLIEVRILWAIAGAKLGVKTSIEVWVNYPRTGADNDAAATLLHPEVGMYVALGGGATHLKEAVSRLESVFSAAGALREVAGDQAAAGRVRGYAGLLHFDAGHGGHKPAGGKGKTRKG
jgi:hypothetical protein